MMRRIAFAVLIEAIGSIDALLSRKASNNKNGLFTFNLTPHDIRHRLGEAKEKYDLVGKAEKDFFYLIARSVSSTRNDIRQRPIANGNGDCFLHSELTRTHSRFNVPVYKTFVGRGIFVNHQSDKLDQCFGTQLDTRFSYADLPVHYADTSVHNLVAVDMSKAEDLGLMQGIRSGILSTWSMGCDIEAAECSICGNRYARQDDEVCEHIASFKGSEMTCESDSFGWRGARIKACDLLMGPTFVELSLVGVPADHMSETIEALGAPGERKTAASWSEIAGVPNYMPSFGENISVRNSSDIQKNEDGTYTALYNRECQATFADKLSADKWVDQLRDAAAGNARKINARKIIERKTSDSSNSFIAASKILRGDE